MCVYVYMCIYVYIYICMYVYYVCILIESIPRAGVPSQLAKQGANSEQIAGAGRWSSEAYEAYCKLPRTHIMNMADHICDLLE